MQKTRRDVLRLFTYRIPYMTLILVMAMSKMGLGSDWINWFPLILFFFCIEAQAQSPGSMGNDSGPGTTLLTGPGLAIVIGVLSIMFAMTFLLLVYAKYCRRPQSSDFTIDDAADQRRFGFGFGLGLGNGGGPGELGATSHRFSGIDKTVIESLPFFRFSSLKGAREGLECAVCLSKFEDIEILRLVPKCKHAFHIDCVDRWLENHSSCPLCRQKVDPSDFTIFTYSNSLRIPYNPSNLTDDSNLEYFVRREQDNENNQVRSSSSRFSIGSSFRKIEMGKQEEEVPNQEEQPIIKCENDDGDDDDRQLLHKFKHMIIVSDVVCKNRWSDVNSSDLMLLNAEMLRVMSSKRFDSSASSSVQFTPAMAVSSDNGYSSNPNEKQIMKIKEEMERKREFESKIRTNYSFSNSKLPSTVASASRSESNPYNQPSPSVQSGARCVSEISFSRFPDYIVKNRIRESVHRSSGKEERISKAWIPIARRTVQWFAGREKRSQQQSQNTSNV